MQQIVHCRLEASLRGLGFDWEAIKVTHINIVASQTSNQVSIIRRLELKAFRTCVSRYGVCIGGL